MLPPSLGIQQPSSAGIPVNKGKYSWAIGCGRVTDLDVDFRKDATDCRAIAQRAIAQRAIAQRGIASGNVA